MRISDWSSDVCSSDLMVTTEPVEIIPIPHLIFHFCLTGLPGAYPDTAAVPEYLSAYHIANGTVVQSLHGFAVVELVMALKPNDYIQFFSFCFFGGSQYRSEERRVGKECGSTGRCRWWRYH